MERAQYLYIDSSQCAGTPYDFKVTLPAKALHCDKNERIRVSLVRWTCRNDWYTIREPDNVFYVNGEPVEIPEGNYRYTQWAATLEALLRSDIEDGVIVYFESKTHKLTFTFPTEATRTFTFPPRRTRAWGFTQTAVTSSEYCVPF